MYSTYLRLAFVGFSFRRVRALMAGFAAVGACASLPAGTPTPQFDSIPSQGSGVVLSDPTIQPMQGPGSPANFFAMRPIDLRGNGRPDLFTCYGIIPPAPAQKMPCRVFRPQLDGSITDITRQLFGNGALPGAVAPRVIVPGDFNEDGRPDVFIACQGWDANPFPGEVNVLLLSNSDGTYTDASANLTQTPDFTHDACVGDVNGDGHLDIYVGSVGTGAGPYLLLGAGNGTFTKVTAGLPATLKNYSEKFTACAFADIDGDGRPDLVLGVQGDVSLDSIVLFNDGHGDFTQRPRLVLPAGPLGRGNTIVQAIGVLDINRDGKPDLILQSTQSTQFGGMAVQILINQGNGVLADETTARLGTAASRTTGGPIQALRFADLNADGLTDFYFSNGPAQDGPRYFLANADGTFTAVAQNALPIGFNFGVSAVNFDRDSRVDLLQISHSSTGDVLYQSFLNHTVVPPIQTYVAAIGAAPLKAPLTADFSPGSTYTMEGWFYLTGYSERSWLMGKETTAGGDPFLSFGLTLGGGDGSHLLFATTTGSAGSFRTVMSPNSLPLRTWVHCAAVLDGTVMRLLINGQEVGTGTALGPPAKLDNVAFGVGQAFFANGGPSYNPFPGSARSVRFWNVARSDAQLAAALGESLPTDAAGLVAAWPLDESSGPAARDISGHSFVLTAASGVIAAARTAVLEAGPFFAETVTAVTDGSLQYLQNGQLIDFDGDGDLDLVIGQMFGPPTYPETRARLRAFRDNNGTFVDVTDAVLGDVSMVNPFTMIAADFNGDGRTDLFIGGSGTDTPPAPGEQSKLLIQSTDGRLVDETASRLPSQIAFNHHAAAADIDGDGDLDIYLCHIGPWPNGPRFLINNGSGYFTEATDRIPADITNLNTSFTSCVLVDVNGDGRPDLVLGANTNAAGNELLLNDGTGHFGRNNAFTLPPKLHDATAVTVKMASADLNGDGHPDLVMATGGGQEVLSAPGTSVDGSILYGYTIPGLQILINRSDGTFDDATIGSGITWSAREKSVARLKLIDFNGDGRIDILAEVPVVGGGMTLRIFLNVGDANTVRFVDVSEAYDGTGGAFFLAGDFDRDGKTDLLKVSGTAVTVARSIKPIDPVLFADAPAITTQPMPQVATAGGSITFTVAASGYPTPTYQWQKNGQNISGATGGSYTIASPTLADAGAYTVVITNAAGTVTSSTASLYVVTAAGAPYFAAQPSDQTVSVGATATFTVAAGGSPAPTYQWQKGGTPITGATNATFTLTNVTTNDTGSYVCIAKNDSGTATSSSATLTVTKVTPTISWPAPTAITYGTALSAVQLSATTGVPGTFTYNPASGVVPGAGSQTLNVTFTPTDAANYTTATATQTLTVNKVALTARADDKSKVQGAANPALTITYTGFVNGDTKAAITEPTISTSATTDSLAGAYPIMLSGGAAANYTFTLQDGTLTVTPGAFLANLSVRAAMAAGQTLIVGFVVDGGAKPMLVRAAGPALNNYGLTGVVDPRLGLYNGGTLVGQNDNWDGSLATTFATLGAFPFDSASKDAALLQSINGPHTAQAVATGPGAILVEAYDAGPNDGRRLVNLSTRFQVGTGDNILIAGFVVSGTGTRQLLIRAVGPTLDSYGVTGTLVDPQLDVYDGGTSIASNDNWSSTLTPTFDLVGAFHLLDASKDAAIVVTLLAGKPYTVQVSGVGNTTGEALIELYLMP